MCSSDLNIVSGGGDYELTTIELNTITKLVNDTSSDDVEIIFGTAIDGELDDKVKVTIIATGFSNSENGIDEFKTISNNINSQTNLFEENNFEFINNENEIFEEVVHNIDDEYHEYEDSVEKTIIQNTNDRSDEVVIEELDSTDSLELDESSDKKNEYLIKRKKKNSKF